MNSTWLIEPLESLCDRITVGWVGPMINEYVEDGVPFLRSQNISPFSVTTENLKFITPEFHDRIRKSSLRAGDVAVVRTGYPGTAAVVPEWLSGSNCADLVVITPGPRLDPLFLCAVFNSTWGIASVGGKLVGSAQQHFNVAAAKRMEIHVPPLPSQRKIAAILSAYEELIENNNRRISLLDEMAQRIYREWFVDFRYPGHEQVRLVDSEIGPIPDGWEVGVLDDLVVLQRGFDLPKSQRMAGTVPVIAASGWHGTHSDAKVTGPGVVTGRSGSLGSVAYVEEDFWPLNTTLWGKEYRRATPQYAYFLLRQLDLAGFNSGAAVPTLNRNDIRQLPQALPPRHLVEQFSAAALGMLSLIRCLERSVERAGATRDLLLPRLISGEVDVAELDIAMQEVAA